jgi:DNA-binding transcriptional regulator GbsR (MarR family)
MMMPSSMRARGGTKLENAAAPLEPALYRACEAVGQVVELWGFKRVHGMIWMYMYLQSTAVTTKDIQGALGISAGLVSMSLAELQHWAVVHRHSAPGERKDFYTAEANIGRPILKVLREREAYQLGVMIETLRVVREGLDAGESGPAQVAVRQLDALIRTGELGQELFNRFLDLGGLLLLREGASPGMLKDVGKTLVALRRFLMGEEESRRKR